MNAPERRRRKHARKEERQAVLRTGSLRAFRRVAEEIAANLPEPRKGESIMRELAELRLRGGKF
jgi:hypothetical protein